MEFSPWHLISRFSLVNCAMPFVDCPNDGSLRWTGAALSSSSIRRKDVVNEEIYCLKFLRVRLWCIWLSTIFVKHRQVVDFWVKKRSPVWKKLSYFFPAPFKFPRMIASTVISVVVYITAVLGSHNIGKARRGLLQLNLKILLILDIHLRDYRRGVTVA